MKIVWTVTARNQLRRIRDYIAADSAAYAHQMVERVRRRTRQIGRFPLLAGIVPEYSHDDIREVLEGP